jgi:hypothetical protein
MVEKHVCFKNKIVLGFIETVKIKGNAKKDSSLKARIDSGAQNSAIDQELAAKLKLGPIIKNKAIRQASGRSVRPVMKASIEICGKKLKGEFTISDRSHMKYKVLIGQNLLKKGFIIDPCKK